MGTDITPKFYETLAKHLENGIPLKHCSFSPSQRQRAAVCLDVVHKLEDNDMMDVKAYLRRRWGRTDTEIRQDAKVVNWLIAELHSDTKELSRYRIIRNSEKIIRMGQATGDWKAIEAGTKMLYKAEGLDKPESAVDVEANTHMLPPVIVETAPNGVRYSEEQLDKLRKKYHVEKDHTQEMVEAKMGLFIPSGSIFSDTEELECVPPVVPPVPPAPFAPFDSLDSSTPLEPSSPFDPLDLSTPLESSSPFDPFAPSDLSDTSPTDPTIFDDDDPDDDGL